MTPLRKAVTVFGFDYPDEELDKLMAGDRRPQVQTRLFARRLTQALQVAFDLPLYCISAAPISDYPTSSHLIVRKSKEAIIDTTEGQVDFSSISHINVGILKILSRIPVSLMKAVGRSLRQTDGFVFVYSVHVPFMLSGLLLAKLSNSTSVAVWTDPPGLLLNRNAPYPKLLIRKMENLAVRTLAKRFDRVIAVTETLAKSLAPDVDFLVIEAMTDEDIRPPARYRDKGPTIFTYTGGISKENGVDALVNAVTSLPESTQIVLNLYGSGDYADTLREIADGHERIIFHGTVQHQEALDAQSSSDFLVNARGTTEDFTFHSFPSKTLEYLGSGVPVLSTRLPGIPADYWNVLIPIEDSSPSAIAETLLRTAATNCEERKAMGQRGRQFAQSKTYIEQAYRIREFVLPRDTE